MATEEDNSHKEKAQRMRAWAFTSRLQALPFRSGLVHLLTSRMESFTNCRLGSTNCMTWSMVLGQTGETVTVTVLQPGLFYHRVKETGRSCMPAVANATHKITKRKEEKETPA